MTDYKTLEAIAKASFSNCEYEEASVLFKNLQNYPKRVDLANIYLARIYSKIDTPQNAISQWELVLGTRPDIAETRLQLARLHKLLNRYALALHYYQEYEKMVSKHAESKREIKTLKIQVAHQQAPLPSFKMQHIAIAGVSYSGSTLLSRILGNLDGVGNIGESHWLVDKRDAGHGTEIDFDNFTMHGVVPCYNCGTFCSALDFKFRRSLAEDPSNWYYKIAERLDCKILVSADKNYRKYFRNDPSLRFDAIVLFKSPLQSWYSNHRKNDSKNEDMNPVADLADYECAWSDAYQMFLNGFQNQGKKVFLSFDHFCQSPLQHLQKLCKLLDIPFQENILSMPTKTQHCFGGNADVNKIQHKKLAPLQVKQLKTVSLPSEHIKWIEQCGRFQETYRQLEEAYNTTFWGQ